LKDTTRLLGGRILEIKGMASLTNKKGSMLIIALLLIIVLVTLGAAFVVLIVNERATAEKFRRQTVAFNLAEAGIERAIYDLRQDFNLDTSSPSWADGDINGYSIGPDTANFYAFPYASTSLNNGTYSVELKNDAASTRGIWIKSIGTYGNSSQTIQVYAKIYSVSPWDNAIFAGSGASGAMINGNCNIRGSVHILGTGVASTDYVVDLGGTADLIGNNYNGLDATLKAKVPALPTRVYGGETVSTLNAVLRIKHGIAGLSGSATAGEVNVAGNAVKETIDASYVTDGFGGTAGTGNVHSDNGWSNGYDLGDAISFPSLSTPYEGYPTYQAYLRDHALVITDAAKKTQLENITTSSNFSYSDANGTIAMNGSGGLTVSGIVYIDGGALKMSGGGTITYGGKGSILATADSTVDVNLLTNGNNSFPTSVVGIMTPGSITIGSSSQRNVMGLFYAENKISMAKQTNVMGTIVSNYFDMGSQVPSIWQVPNTINSLAPGMIGKHSAWRMAVVSWQQL